MYVVTIIGVPLRKFTDKEISTLSDFATKHFIAQATIINPNTFFVSTSYIQNEIEHEKFLEVSGINDFCITLSQLSVEVSVTVAMTPESRTFSRRYPAYRLPKKCVMHIITLVGNLSSIPSDFEKVFIENDNFQQVRCFRNSSHLGFYTIEKISDDFTKDSSIIYSTFRKLIEPNRTIHITSFDPDNKKMYYEDYSIMMQNLF